MATRDLTLNQIWKRFDAWSDEYLAKCEAAIDGIERDNWKGDTLFLSQRPDDDACLADVLGFDGFDASAYRQVAWDKLTFLRNYFRDISFDGIETFQNRMRILPLQAPRRRKGTLCVWLEQDIGRKEITSSPEYPGSHLSLMCRSVNDIDFASAYGVLPFDYIRIEKFGGVFDSEQEARDIALSIKRDLEFDGLEFVMKAEPYKAKFITLVLIWNPKDPPVSELENPLPKSSIVRSPKSTTLSKKVATAKSRTKKAARTNGARSDASIGSIARKIETAFDLPKGSVKLVLPNGRTAHRDGKVQNLRSKWDPE